MNFNLSRRDMLKMGLFSTAALALPAERVARTQVAIANRIAQSQLPAPFTVPFAIPPVLAPVGQDATTDYYVLTQKQVSAQILPGLHTDIWGYNGITPGPTIMNTQGRNAVVRQINDLPEVHPSLRYNVWTSTHLHGSCSLPEYDGYASDITKPGQFKDYHYPNIQDARTLWYHDHGVHITATNAYMGLAAQYILHDPVELALPIPHGKYDVPMILKDAMFQKDGQLVFDDNGQNGIYGDVILVNGRPWPLMEVEPRKYRFRVLNASVSRSYDLALSTGEPLTVIGTDGGLMPHPKPCGNVKIGMAERYEIVIDFAKYAPGTQVVLQNLQPPNNIDYDNTNVVMAFKVGSYISDPSNNELPQDLNPNMNVMGLTEADAKISRNFRFERKDGHWTVNGTTWEDVVNSDYNLVCANPGYGDVEIWELQNPGGGWFHPVHIHLVDFKVLDRNGKAPHPWEEGPKDVVYVGESETVRVIMKFENQRGKYMMHCHNLVHEDHDMMTQFQVGEMDRTQDPHDPIEADKCKDFKDMGELFRPKPNNSGNGNGNGNAEERGNDTISVPADVPAEQAAATAPAPASGAPAAPAAPKPGVKVLGSKRKSKVKVKPRRKVKAKAKKVTAKKPVSKKPAAKKLGARKSPSARALKVRRGRK
jgi:FtsP/CotA-like multicopper oxidase with cupredoxin domain